MIGIHVVYTGRVRNRPRVPVCASPSALENERAGGRGCERGSAHEGGRAGRGGGEEGGDGGAAITDGREEEGRRR